MTEIDDTMRRLLAVHRAELNDREALAASYKSQLDTCRYSERQAKEQAERLAKLELAGEREAHTATREAAS